MTYLALILGLLFIVAPIGVVVYRVERSTPHIDRIPLAHLVAPDQVHFRQRRGRGPDADRIDAELATLVARRRDGV